MERFAPLFKKIGFQIEDEKILTEAFTHRSVLNEKRGLQHNERLEFLGDAVLELVTTDFLFHNYDSQEGILTNYRSALVKKETLARIGRGLELGELLHLSRGEEASGGREKDYLLANTLEALIGAIYLVNGLEQAREFIGKWILVELPAIIKSEAHVDAKSNFQEVAQAEFEVTPHYEVLSESGPDHDKTFVLGAFLEEVQVGEGTGGSKREAQMRAAEDALKNKKNWKK